MILVSLNSNSATIDSRAIMCYLVNRYDPESKLYPRDPLKRAKIDQMLYYDLGTLYKRMGDYLV